MNTTIINGQPCEPFDYDKYKAGREVVTRDGREVTQLVRFEGTEVKRMLYGVINNFIVEWYVNGTYYLTEETANDLFLLPDTREMWVAVDTLNDKYYIYSNEEVLDDVLLMAKVANSDNEKHLKKAKLIIYGQAN